MDDDTNALTSRIIGLAMRVHTRLGPGLLENAEKHCLCHELDLAGSPYQGEADLPLDYGGTRLDCGYRASAFPAAQTPPSSAA